MSCNYFFIAFNSSLYYTKYFVQKTQFCNVILTIDLNLLKQFSLDTKNGLWLFRRLIKESACSQKKLKAMKSIAVGSKFICQFISEIAFLSYFANYEGCGQFNQIPSSFMV